MAGSPRTSVTARFGGVGTGQEGMSVRFEANSVLHLVDQVTGYFRGGPFQRAVERAHIAMAQEIQIGMANKLDDEMAGHSPRRPQRPGERLKSAILDGRNVELTASGFLVGRPAWYDESSAELYWRSIERGLGGYTTTAVFTNDFATFSRPGQSGGPHMRMPQFGKRATPVEVKAFPGYQFHKGGMDVFDRLDIVGHYVAMGVPLSAVRSGGKK